MCSASVINHCSRLRGILTAPNVQRARPYRWAALPGSARTRRPPEPRSHPGPGSAGACTEEEGWVQDTGFLLGTQMGQSVEANQQMCSGVLIRQYGEHALLKNNNNKKVCRGGGDPGSEYKEQDFS